MGLVFLFFLLSFFFLFLLFFLFFLFFSFFFLFFFLFFLWGVTYIRLRFFRIGGGCGESVLVQNVFLDEFRFARALSQKIVDDLHQRAAFPLPCGIHIRWL